MRETPSPVLRRCDILGLAKILTELRADVTHPGDPGGTVRKRIRPACPITTPATKDHVWIPTVTARAWLIVTRGSRIQSHRAELGAVREHGARMVALAGREAVDTWHPLEVFIAQWCAIERLTQESGRSSTASAGPPALHLIELE